MQALEANVTFPLAVSYRLKINALRTLIVIIAVGIVWIAIGIVLFLPFAAILKLITDRIEERKRLRILLGIAEDPEE